MKFALVVPQGDRAPLHFVGHGHFRCHAVQEWVNAVPGDIWEGNDLTDGGAIEALATYDVIMVNQNTSMYGITCDLATRYNDPPWTRRPKVLALDGGSVDALCISATHIRAGLIQAARAVDMYCTFQPWATAFYSTLTNKPVRYVGCPVPLDMIRQHRKPWSERRKRVAVGVQLGLGSGVDRNGIGTCFALRKVLGPEWEIDIAYTHDIEREFAEQFGLNLTMHKVIDPQPRYWADIGDCRFGIMLDLSYTWGRFAADMACLGIPCIGVNRNGTQGHLWPDLTVDDPFQNMGEVLEMIATLANDDDGRESENHCALANAVADEQFSEAAAAARFRAAVAELGVTH